MRGKAIAVALLLAVCNAGFAHAQWQENDGFILVNGSYVGAKAAATDQWVNGAGLGFAYESVTWDTQVALGTLLSFSRMTKTGELDSLGIQVDSWLLYFYLKYFFIGQDKFLGWVAPSFGLQMTDFQLVDSAGGSTPSTGSSANIALGIPIGVTWRFSDTIFLNGSYAFNWMNNDIYKSGIVQALTVALVFKIR